MKKVLTVITASVFALCMSVAIAAHHNSQVKQSQPASRQAPSYLFVISAKKGQLKKGRNGTTLLMIKRSDLDRTIMFSDRPRRIVKYINGSELAKDWQAGSNNFASASSSAVLSAANMKPEIVVISGIEVTARGVALQVKAHSPLLRRQDLKHIVVVVDNPIHNPQAKLACKTHTDKKTCIMQSNCTWIKDRLVGGCMEWVAALWKWE